MRQLATLAVVLLATPAAHADPVGLTATTFRKEITIGSRLIVIERNQSPDATIAPEFARTSRPCPPFCITPVMAAPGVATLGELEVVAFLEQKVANGQGVLVDARLPDFFRKGTLPGAVNVPFAALDPANPYRDAILEALGAIRGAAGWDFGAVRELVVLSNGAWCEQAPRAIGHLLGAGYPAHKLSYYRGGMQDWLMLGLGTVLPPVTN
jgi:rhodanese-related sulfurtransferase